MTSGNIPETPSSAKLEWTWRAGTGGERDALVADNTRGLRTPGGETAQFRVEDAHAANWFYVTADLELHLAGKFKSIVVNKAEEGQAICEYWNGQLPGADAPAPPTKEDPFVENLAARVRELEAWRERTDKWKEWASRQRGEWMIESGRRERRDAAKLPVAHLCKGEKFRPWPNSACSICSPAESNSVDRTVCQLVGGLNGLRAKIEDNAAINLLERCIKSNLEDARNVHEARAEQREADAKIAEEWAKRGHGRYWSGSVGVASEIRDAKISDPNKPIETAIQDAVVSAKAGGKVDIGAIATEAVNPAAMVWEEWGDGYRGCGAENAAGIYGRQVARYSIHGPSHLSLPFFAFSDQPIGLPPRVFLKMADAKLYCEQHNAGLKAASKTKTPDLTVAGGSDAT